MPLIHYRLALLVLPIHRHPHCRRLLLRKPPQRNSRPPFQLSLACATIVRNNDYLLRPLLICRARRWDWEDSNAESFRTQNNLNYNNFGGDDDDDEQWDDVLQEYIDSIWIFKVFSSYGWALPFILFPLVVINGPKAFLLALAVPIWISTFSFALQKMWNGKGKKRGKPKNNKTRSSASSSSRIVDEFGKERKKSRMGYKSWVQWDDDDDSSFGGWDKVDSEREFELRNSIRSGRSQKSPSDKNRLSEERIRERVGRIRTPLLLRLLIAVFPFLSSWTKTL